MSFFRFNALTLLFLLFLASCQGVGGGAGPTARYILPDHPGGRLCAIQCRSAFDHCDSQCLLQERACVNEVQAQAIKDYEAYAQEQFLTRAPVELRLRDFERTGGCKEKSCRKACQNNYEDCFTSCGGRVEREGACTFLCGSSEGKK